MGQKDRYTPDEVQRIVGLSEKQLEYWDRLRLVSPQKDKATRYYNFRDIISLRTVKQLVEQGVPANRIRRALVALRGQLAHEQASLAELRIHGDGGDVVVERDGARLEPLSGQFVMNFEVRELGESVRVMTGKKADDWLAVALEYESDDRERANAIDAYERAFRVDPARPDALLNCGTLYYEEGNLEKASEYFRQALVLDPENALAHFNLGSVLDETGHLDAARQHLRQAVRLNPIYPDAHYNLAFVCEKLKAFSEAQQHWLAYVKLDPAGPWSSYARQRLAASAPSPIGTRVAGPRLISKSQTTGK